MTGTPAPEGWIVNIEEVDGLIELGRGRGFVTADDIAEILAEVDLTTEQIELVYTTLLDQGIDVIDESCHAADYKRKSALQVIHHLGIVCPDAAGSELGASAGEIVAPVASTLPKASGP